MPGKRPYYEFEHEGEQKTIEADTWMTAGDEIVFAKYIMDGPTRREEEIARFKDVDYRTINRVIPEPRSSLGGGTPIPRPMDLSALAGAKVFPAA